MKLTRILAAAALTILPLAASAATIIVPAAGTGPGANDSQWQSELTLHSSAPREITVLLRFHTDTSISAPATVKLGARETLSIGDVVTTRFGVTAATGALTLEVADRDAKSLAVTSRTFNSSAAGEFGQDIPAVNAPNGAGEILTLAAPSAIANARFNFGVFAATEATIQWELVRANGQVAATRTAAYTAGQHAQYNAGIETFLNAAPANNDVVYARILSGSAVAYGSAINNGSGDPTFVPAVRTREGIVIQFVGLDLDEDGTVDLVDADGDGTLDQTLEIVTSLFAAYFRVVARGEFGEPVTLEVANARAMVDILDTAGTVRVAAFGDLKNTTGTIVFRATSEGTTTLLTIPVRYR